MEASDRVADWVALLVEARRRITRTRGYPSDDDARRTARELVTQDAPVAHARFGPLVVFVVSSVNTLAEAIVEASHPDVTQHLYVFTDESLISNGRKKAVTVIHESVDDGVHIMICGATVPSYNEAVRQYTSLFPIMHNESNHGVGSWREITEEEATALTGRRQGETFKVLDPMVARYLGIQGRRFLRVDRGPLQGIDVYQTGVHLASGTAAVAVPTVADGDGDEDAASDISVDDE